MSPRDWFILVLRSFGIWRLIEAILALSSFIGGGAGLWRSTNTTPEYWLLQTFLDFALAVWLLKFAPATARFFYSDDDPL